jgi:hypothetical protein
VTEDERAVRARIARLRGELREDRVQLARCLEDARLANARMATTPDDPAVLALAAVALHGWYTGFETMLERVARQLDGDVPEGARWHRELITQLAVEVPGVRPAVLSAAVVGPLAELLSFRHFFRHAYGVVLDGALLGARLATLLSVAPEVSRSFDGFDAFLAGAVGPG